MSDVRPEHSINWHMGWPAEKGPFPTRMVETIVLALQKPLADLNGGELRLLVTQGVALEYSVALALKMLESEPMLNGGHDRGDLLSACLELQRDFWKEHTNALVRFRTFLTNLRMIDRHINARVQAFLALELEPESRIRKPKKTKGAKP